MFFWYGDAQSYEFEPVVQAWLKGQGDGVAFKRVPVAFSDNFVVHSKLYFALLALGVEEKLTPQVFNAFHKDKNRLLTPGAQADFLAGHGVDKTKFLDAFNSFSVQNQAKQAADQLKSYRIDAVPTVVVCGKYKTGPTYASGVDGIDRVLDYLVKQNAV